MDAYPVLDVLVTMVAFCLLVAWVGCLFFMFRDIFRSADLSGTAKAAWTLLVFVLPLVGVLLYLAVRGGGLHDRDVDAASHHPRRER
ncbi:PLD nuclease N-terminal domain-containing protein [Nocardioides panacis]|uniref:PLD nuclease N-terminal domain-containing protein n=1 Tax=Nocardioides panacis TaxID=2849501 RepID=A0A975T0S1_9ACTN|nr:PLDc N-terminal domain-containing protein [Nocardioides panacis]QWZ08784.1 PLD nuclease N-terminal domain-containing protein [Nocardioides panacis]